MLTNTNLITAGERETSIDKDDFEMLELAEELLDKLKEMWENNN
jgi:hypothetical protein